jgi:hypothetical protein
MHVNNGNLGAQCKAAVPMYKDHFGIAVLSALHAPVLKMYSKFTKKVTNFLLGFLKMGCMAD